jgi:hypothetical protein
VTHVISTTSRRELSSRGFFFFARQGTEGNSCHSDRIRTHIGNLGIYMEGRIRIDVSWEQDAGENAWTFVRGGGWQGDECYAPASSFVICGVRRIRTNGFIR